MGSNGFSVDTPFTDLDIDRDFENFEIDNNQFDNDNFSIDLNQLNFTSGSSNFLVRTIRNLSSLFTKKKWIDEFNLDDFDSHDGFNLDDETMILNNTHSRRRGRWMSSMGLSLMVLIAGLLITLVVLIAQKGSPQLIPNKPIYSNGTVDYFDTSIVISIDGFHPNYISSVNTPFMDSLYKNESSYISPYMIPSNPSVTFTNHWSIVTGLLPIYHGIVGNKFFDRSTGDSFDRSSPTSLNSKWWGGEPIWSTLRKNNFNVATHMWPGSEVDLEFNPNYVDKFNKDEDLDSKFQRLVQFLEYPLEKRPQLILSYIPIIDTIGHKVGVSGDELKNALAEVDSFIAKLFTYLSDSNLNDFTNVIIVSDHGMSPTSKDRTIQIDDLVDVKSIEHFDGWPLYGLRPYKNVQVEELFKSMQTKWKSHPLKDKFEVKLSEDIQGDLFGGSNPTFNDRIAPIWVIPKTGYLITKKSDKDPIPKGVHGYDKNETLMRSLFMATGPFFKKKLDDNKYLKPFQNIEIYNIICESFGIKGNENNGTMDSVISMDNLLDNDWEDEDVYPGVDFPIEILKEKSSYYELFITGGEEKQPEDDKKEKEGKPDDSDESDDDSDDEDEDEDNIMDNQKEQSENNNTESDNAGEAPISAQKPPEPTPDPTTLSTTTIIPENTDASPTGETKELETNTVPPKKSWWGKFKEEASEAVEDAGDYIEDKIDDIEDFFEDKESE